MGQWLNKDGIVVEVDDAFALSQGFTPLSEEQQYDTLQDEAIESRGDTLTGKINAAATGALSGITLGLSDVALSSLSTQNERERIKQDRETNRGIATAAEIAGGVASSFAAPGSFLGKTPAGYLSRAAEQGIAASRTAGGVKAAAGTAGFSGLEAAAQSAGSYLSETALGDRELTAEGMAGALGRGFGFGAIAGGSVYGIEKGTIAARRMFSRVADGGENTAKLAEAAWSRQSDEAISANDSTYETAKARLAEIQTQKRLAMEARGQASADLAQARLDAFDAPPAAKTTQGAPAPAGIPQTADDIHLDGIETTVRARDLEGREWTTLPGVGEDAVKMDKARAAIKEGQRDAIKVNVSPGGKLDIEDGRHRFAAAMESDAPIKIRWQRGSSGLDATAPTGLPARASARGYSPTPSVVPSLERQLAEMQGELSTGKTLQDLNAEPRVLSKEIAEEEARLTDVVVNYEQRKQAVQDWIANAKNPRRSLDMDTPGVIRGRRTEALPTDVVVEQSGGGLYLIGKGERTLDDLTPNSRVLAGSNGPKFSVGSKLDEEYEDMLDLARLAEEPADRTLALAEAADIEKQIWKYVRDHKPENAAVIDRIMELRAANGVDGIAAAEKRVTTRMNREAVAMANGPLVPPKPNASEEAGYQATLRGGGDRGLPNIVDDTHAAAKVLGDYEKAAAELTEVVGDAAAPTSKQGLDGFRKAESEAERKAFDRGARAVDDSVEGVVPPPASPAERIQTAKRGKLEADANLAKLSISERQARADVKASAPARASKTKQPANANAPEPGTRLGSAADMGAALEAADTLGIPGLPRPSDLPIIGPLLGAYLKFRALKAISGRMTGRVAATAETKAASLAAKTKDRAAIAVDRALGLAERAMPRARKAATQAAGQLDSVLRERIFDDGEPDAPESASPQQVAVVRARELAYAAANPQAVIAQVRKELRDITDPDLIAAAEKHRLAGIAHLNEHAPKGPLDSPFIKRPWSPSLAQVAIFARRLAVFDDPVSAIEAVEKKTLTPEAAETFRALNPKLFATMQSRMMERSSEIKETLPYKRRLDLSSLFDVPLDPSVEPETIALLQSVHVTSASATQGPAAPSQNAAPVPSTAAPVDLTALYQPTADRRALRR